MNDSITMSDKVELIRRYSQGVETPDYHTLLTDAALMAIEADAERALADDLAGVLTAVMSEYRPIDISAIDRSEFRRVLARHREARGQ
jgi:hypothetical protein